MTTQWTREEREFCRRECGESPEHSYRCSDLRSLRHAVAGADADIARLKAENASLRNENECLRKGLLGAETLETIAEETTNATLRAENASLSDSLAAVKEEMPDTFYAGAPFSDRVKHLVRIWHNAISANIGLEAARAAAEKENASLLESLREKGLYAEEVRLCSVDYAQQLKESRAHAAAAEQRAEAAEKEREGLERTLSNANFGLCGALGRARDLEKVLALIAAPKPCVDMADPAEERAADALHEIGLLRTKARAALHDEERSAPPQEEGK